MGAVVTRIRHLQELLTVIPPWTHDYRECFRKLAESCRTKISLTRDPTDTKEAIKLPIVTRLNSSGQYIVVQCGHSLCSPSSYQTRIRKIDDLNKSIGVLAGIQLDEHLMIG